MKDNLVKALQNRDMWRTAGCDDCLCFYVNSEGNELEIEACDYCWQVKLKLDTLTPEILNDAIGALIAPNQTKEVEV